MMQRADPLWQLLRDDPRFCSHGRDVQLSDRTDDNLDAQIALARIQGAAGCCGVATRAADQRRKALEAAGFAVDEYVEWHGGQTCLDAAKLVISSRKLPEDIEVCQVGPETPYSTLAALDEVTQSCGVLLPNGSFVRGQERQGVCMYALSQGGDVVAAAASVTQFHDSHPRGEQAWWGMLATRKDRRGQGLAVVLGALVMVAMNEKHGIRNFYTGIREGNLPSEKLCESFGLRKTECLDIIAIDQSQIPEGRTTK